MAALDMSMCGLLDSPCMPLPSLPSTFTPPAWLPTFNATEAMVPVVAKPDIEGVALDKSVSERSICPSCTAQVTTCLC